MRIEFPFPTGISNEARSNIDERISFQHWPGASSSLCLNLVLRTGICSVCEQYRHPGNFWQPGTIQPGLMRIGCAVFPCITRI